MPASEVTADPAKPLRSVCAHGAMALAMTRRPVPANETFTMSFSSSLRSLKSTLNLGLARGRTSPRSRPCQWKPRLQVESLEDRTLPSLFGLQTPFLAGAKSVSVVVGDFNHDGKPDLVVGNQFSDSDGNSFVTVLLGNGLGGFGPAPEGMAMWLIGMVAIIGVALWIGTRS